MGFETIEDEIKPILEVNLESRADDMVLYCIYVQLHNADIRKVMNNREYRIKHGIKPIESIARIRRKLQHKYEDLRPEEKYLIERQRAEKEYLLYARDKK